MGLVSKSELLLFVVKIAIFILGIKLIIEGIKGVKEFWGYAKEEELDSDKRKARLATLIPFGEILLGVFLAFVLPFLF